MTRFLFFTPDPDINPLIIISLLSPVCCFMGDDLAPFLISASLFIIRSPDLCDTALPSPLPAWDTPDSNAFFNIGFVNLFKTDDATLFNGLKEFWGVRVV